MITITKIILCNNKKLPTNIDQQVAIYKPLRLLSGCQKYRNNSKKVQSNQNSHAENLYSNVPPEGRQRSTEEFDPRGDFPLVAVSPDPRCRADNGDRTMPRKFKKI